ncbi:MAG: DUF1428 domain-containing protein [Gammaproteobacteria bacterium]|nr:DUF1428 domain-containing protein [Gammaproteobacteria bacterium]
MPYIDGFVMAVPRENKQEFVEYARLMDSLIIDFGALRVMECWEDDVNPGDKTDMRRAVDAEEGEAVVFSWVEWPDKETRQRGHEQMQELMRSGDERFMQDKTPAPFDGSRMIFGGFTPALSLP